ncbi:MULTISPECIES: hypothetical protein [unclassified Coleofasciculus]|uniref:hypothetical protein n=1 Tax=unclassified Coleofasciculus TaxID=2692782 RepID=UPI00187E2107|nr:MULTISPECIES: hypothetical protein [unclassified Coleofasciculus]MBE9128370.1 hypothetical protein [Coleofasciculus sp. LEGE 07081]MBE9151426.1 hypothetical protein [Coleofasciculus sp. LEGE 07092]
MYLTTLRNAIYGFSVTLYKKQGRRSPILPELGWCVCPMDNAPYKISDRTGATIRAIAPTQRGKAN